MITYNSQTNRDEKEAKAYIALELSKFGKRNKIIAFLCTLLGICGVYMSFVSMKIYGHNFSDIIMAAISLIFIFLGFFGVEKIQKMLFKKNFKDEDKEEKVYSYVIDEKGLTVIENETETHFKWKSFKKWAEHDHFIYIKSRDKDDIYLIDKNKITKNEIKELTTYLKVNVK